MVLEHLCSSIDNHPKVIAARAICADCPQRMEEVHTSVLGNTHTVARCSICKCAVMGKTAFVLVGHHCPEKKW